jgi:hypothetical protein
MPNAPFLFFFCSLSMMSVSLSIGLLEHHLVDADDIATMRDDEKHLVRRWEGAGGFL